MSRSRLRRGCLLACLAIVLAGPGGAQDTAGEAPETPAEPAPEETKVSLAAVLAEAENTSGELKEIRASLAESELDETISSSLAELSKRAQVLEAETQKSLEADLPVEALRGIDARWKSLAGDPNRWDTQLRARGEAFDATLGQLEELESAWEERRKTAAEGPKAVRDQVRETIASVAATQQEAEARLAKVLELQASVGELRSRIETARSSIQSRVDDQLQNLFVRDGVPVWNIELSKIGSEAGLWPVVEARILETREFGSRNPTIVAQLVVLFLAVYSGLLVLRRKMRSQADNALPDEAALFEMSFATALLITLLVAVLVIEEVPPAVDNVIVMVALIPAVLLLRRLVDGYLHGILYCLVLFFFVDRLRDFAVNLQVLSRVIFLLEMLAAIAFVLWLMRPARLRKVPAGALGSQSFRWMGIAARWALALFLLAFAADVFGYVQLGRLIGSAVLNSATAAIIFYALVRIGEHLVEIALRSRQLRNVHLIENRREGVLKGAKSVLRWAGLLFWINSSLNALSIRTPVFGAVSTLFATKLSVGALDVSLGDVAAFFLMILISIWISRGLRVVLEEDVYPRVELQRGMPYAISTLLHYSIVAVGFLFAILAAGIHLDRLAILVGALGVGIGFGLQNVVNNFVSGLLLLFERPIQVGDQVQVGTLGGVVRRIGIRASVVRTWDGAEVVVPNADFISNQLVNWTLSDHFRRVELPVGVAYGSNTELVMEILLKVATDHPKVFPEPPPYVLFKGFGESSLDFEVRGWTHADTRLGVFSELGIAVDDAFAAAGIQIPFPQRDIHLPDAASAGPAKPSSSAE